MAACVGGRMDGMIQDVLCALLCMHACIHARMNSLYGRSFERLSRRGHEADADADPADVCMRMGTTYYLLLTTCYLLLTAYYLAGVCMRTGTGID